jgi:hypothetical protein
MRGAHKLTGQILDRAEQRLAADPRLRPAHLTDSIGESFGLRVHPIGRASAGSPPQAAPRKALTCPPARKNRSAGACPCDLHAATRLLNRPPARMPARSPSPAAGRMPLRATAPRRPARTRACVPARARRAAGKGVTAWQRALDSLAIPQAPSGRPPDGAPAHLAQLPALVAAELISALPAARLRHSITRKIG